MAIVTDFTKASKEIIVDLINGSQTPNSTIGYSDVTFGVPSANADNPGTNGNTAVVVNGVLVNGLKGNVTVTYNRIALSVVQASAEVTFEKGAATTVADLLPLINARFGINLTEEDIVDAALPTLTGGPEPFTLEVVTGHLVFTGSMSLELVPDAQEIDQVVTTTVLDGLEWNTNGQQ